MPADEPFLYQIETAVEDRGVSIVPSAIAALRYREFTTDEEHCEPLRTWRAKISEERPLVSLEDRSGWVSDSELNVEGRLVALDGVVVEFNTKNTFDGIGRAINDLAFRIRQQCAGSN
ncbi:MAG: hypothetical protein ABI411_21175 [Tahibacter sp.]